jgi:hypothetical protein
MDWSGILVSEQCGLTYDVIGHKVEEGVLAIFD